MKFIRRILAAILSPMLLIPVFSGCQKTAPDPEAYTSQGEMWHLGFGRRQIVPDENSEEPLYIAGYNSGVTIRDVLDLCEARAGRRLW